MAQKKRILHPDAKRIFHEIMSLPSEVKADLDFLIENFIEFRNFVSRKTLSVSTHSERKKPGKHFVRAHTVIHNGKKVVRRGFWSGTGPMLDKSKKYKRRKKTNVMKGEKKHIYTKHDRKRFAKALYLAMNEKKITRPDLAKRLRVTQAAVDWWVRGVTMPSPGHADSLCNVLGRTPDQLHINV